MPGRPWHEWASGAIGPGLAGADPTLDRVGANRAPLPTAVALAGVGILVYAVAGPRT